MRSPSGAGDDARRLVRDRVGRADREPAIVRLRCLALAPGGCDVQRADKRERSAEQQRDEHAPVLLHRAERDMHHQHAVGE
jgi:hypothetical protein